AHSIEDVAALLGIAATRLIKILIVKAEVSDTNPHGLLGLVLRGDQELNDIKAEKIPGIITPLTFASDSEIEQILGCKPGCLGPLKLPFPVVVDHSAETMRNFVCGANKDGFHLADANWERDCRFDSAADIRKVR